MVFKFFLIFTILIVLFNQVYGDEVANSVETNDGLTELQQANDTIQVVNLQNDNTKLLDIDPDIQVTTEIEINQKRPKKNSKRRRKQRRRHQKQSLQEADFDIDVLGEEEQKKIIRTTMKYMLGFDHVTTDAPPDAPNTGANSANQPRQNRQDAPKPPHFMLEMYRTYTDDKSLMMLHSISQGNTIRSYFPISANPEQTRDKGRPVTIAPVVDEGDQGEELEAQIPVFFFNLSNIPASEKLVGAEIRLEDKSEDFPTVNSNGQFAGGLDSRENARAEYNRRWYVAAAVYKREEMDCSQGNICREVFSMVGNSIQLSPTSNDLWGDKNLSMKAEAARHRDKILVLRFESQSDINNETPRSRRSAGAPALPQSFFLLGYERPKRDSEMNSILRSSIPFRSTASSPTSDTNTEVHAGELDVSLIPILIVYCNDTRTTIQSKDKSLTPLIWKALSNITSISKRKRRSSDSVTEQVADDQDMRATNGNWQDNEFTTPYKVNKRKGAKKLKKQRKVPTYPNEITNEIENPVENDLTEMHDNSKSNRMLMNSLKNKKSKKRKKRRGKGKKNRRKRGRQNKVPKLSRGFNEVTEDCSRRELVVDFDEINWSSWIISPTAFDAYYCSGMCAIPKMFESNIVASNHALIQGLVRAIGVNKAVPQPCCTPEKMMPLSVLYFDEKDNVVLKVYPDMSVETCGCR